MAMTIYDISKKAGVSIATVSRVLNGSENVRPSTRKKVMDVIDKTITLQMLLRAAWDCIP